jgi:hypothetical protein
VTGIGRSLPEGIGDGDAGRQHDDRRSS